MSVYLFFDESGNLDFTAGGTRHYFMGVLTTRNPVAFTRALSELRYGLLGEGAELEAFHASEDRQVVRNAVYSILADVGEFEFDAVIVDKSRVEEKLRDPARFYPEFAARVLARVFARYADDQEPLVVITDRLPVKRKREAVVKAFKTFIRQELGNRPFVMLHHTSAGHSGLQAADYCLWALHKKQVHGDERSFSIIERFVKSISED